MRGRQESEAAWQSRVRYVARLYGWAVYHTHDSRRSDPGFPDLVIVRERVVVAELKTERGRVTPEQEAWLAAFRAAGVEAYVWRPSDWEDAVRVLAPRASGGR